MGQWGNPGRLLGNAFFCRHANLKQLSAPALGKPSPYTEQSDLPAFMIDLLEVVRKSRANVRNHERFVSPETHRGEPISKAGCEGCNAQIPFATAVKVVC